MRLYVTTYIDDEQGDEHYGASVKWYGTQAEQRSHAKELKRAGMREITHHGTPATEGGWPSYDVLTDKGNLLHFLNQKGVRP